MNTIPKLLVLSRNKFLTSKEYDFVKDIQIMRKLTNRQMRWVIREMRKGEYSTYRIARHCEITPRYARMLYTRHKDVPGYLVDQIRLRKPGRAQRPINDDERKIILELHKSMPICAVKMEKYYQLLGIPRIPHNRIQRILNEAGMTSPLSERVVRKKGVRYERRHSNSLWHTDFTDTVDGKQAMVYLDDASRKVTGKAKFDHATTDNALMLLDRAIQEFGRPKQVMTDHGAQFCANEERVYRFREGLKERGIEHIMARVKRPQTNGKVERWFGSTEKLYRLFGFDLDRVVECYNNMPHLSLDTTPNIAFVEKMPKRIVEPIKVKR